MHVLILSVINKVQNSTSINVFKSNYTPFMFHIGNEYRLLVTTVNNSNIVVTKKDKTDEDNDQKPLRL